MPATPFPFGAAVAIKGKETEAPYLVTKVEGENRWLARDQAISGPWHYSQLVSAS